MFLSSAYHSSTFGWHRTILINTLLQKNITLQLKYKFPPEGISMAFPQTKKPSPASVLYSLQLIRGLSHRLGSGLCLAFCFILTPTNQGKWSSRVFSQGSTPRELRPRKPSVRGWTVTPAEMCKRNVNFLLWHQTTHKLYLELCQAIYLTCKYIPGHGRDMDSVLGILLAHVVRFADCMSIQHAVKDHHKKMYLKKTQSNI